MTPSLPQITQSQVFHLARPPSTTLFLFAHQDDEIGVLAAIESVLATGGRPVCIYLTDGGGGGVSPQTRNAETTSVLRSIGVNTQDLHFVGTDIAIPDGQLVNSLARANDAAIAIAETARPINDVVMHAWEGGHQDHDAAHLIGIAVARHFNVLETSRQFTLYRNDPASRLPFVMFRPLIANGAVLTTYLRPAQRRRYMALMTRYRSQKKTFLGLMPFILWHYLTAGTQLLQPVSLARISEKPNDGLLLYEKRSKFSYAEFLVRSEPFRREIVQA